MRLILVDKTKRKDYILCAVEIGMAIAPVARMPVNRLVNVCLKLEQLGYESQMQAMGDQSEHRIYP